MSISIHVVDDDPVQSLLLTQVLSRAGYEIQSFPDARKALEALQHHAPALLLSDIAMDGIDGFELMRQARARHPNLPVILVTGSTHLEDAVRAIRAGATDYITKPVDPEILLEIVGRALRVAELEATNRSYVEELARRDARLREEMRLASIVQAALLPAQVPNVAGLAIALEFVPSMAIGGDFYDFILFPEPHRIGILAADLSGHGVAGALLSVMFKTIAQRHLKPGASPGAAFLSLNKDLQHSFPDGAFASALYAEIDTERRTLTVVKGSQEPAILLHRNGPAHVLDQGGPVLGVVDEEWMPGICYPEETRTLEPGDTIFLYTDGLIEIEDADKGMLGYETMMVWLEELKNTPPIEMLSTLKTRALAWNGRSELTDDLLLLAVRLT